MSDQGSGMVFVGGMLRDVMICPLVHHWIRVTRTGDSVPRRQLT